MSVSKQHVVRLYRNILKTSKLFPYTYREYTIRRTRDKFKELKVESDPAKFEQGIKDSEKLLEIIQRQSIINGMYNKRNLVVEGIDDTAEGEVKKSFENASQS
ncbi:Protein isd11 [Schizosaccharomyces pombe]|uniref:Protein isd11 n=1 Tax=Schizosaccharomyces pombe (strain 972 / ATCC 24843) TaxID=284812 RepID=ISD11_SCHPO|nr:putative Fe-sulfur cluster assembly protein Isd11 [Schizosaccharomyces pombe]O60068.1 RecName: Full=Protein isd11 [Schizosaccharomyces pombe 972h-]CAA18659.1 mitochondrial iron sulfur cluster assembly protein Isd11 (predicted) [Schizosaccharomyces pombe]|eukprot:NP_596555.1 putative Fe-sulfur cluster assembly protein Isd11 [Schizosaccharomyces pombe]